MAPEQLFERWSSCRLIPLDVEKFAIIIYILTSIYDACDGRGLTMRTICCPKIFDFTSKIHYYKDLSPSPFLSLLRADAQSFLHFIIIIRGYFNCSVASSTSPFSGEVDRD